jgi:hypothetical protein
MYIQILNLWTETCKTNTKQTYLKIESESLQDITQLVVVVVMMTVVVVFIQYKNVDET